MKTIITIICIALAAPAVAQDWGRYAFEAPPSPPAPGAQAALPPSRSPALSDVQPSLAPLATDQIRRPRGMLGAILRAQASRAR